MSYGRGSGQPLGDAERELVWQAALKMKRATGKLNWSELAKQTGFYRITIKAIVEGQQARPASATATEIAELGFALKEPTQPAVAVASDTQPSIRQSIIEHLKRQPATLAELSLATGRKKSEVLAELETMPSAAEDDAGKWRVREAEPVNVIHADRTKMRLESQVKDLDDKYKEALRQIEETETRFENLLAIKEPISPVKIEADPSNDKGEAVAIVQASDWHVEESVEPATVNWLNKYNLDIAKRRAENYFRNTLKLVRKERQDVTIDTLVLHLAGDTISNYLHPELEESNNLSPIEAIRFVKELFVGGLRLWRDDGGFKKIQVVTSYGNHGRLTHKPRFSTGHKNNLEWLAYHDLSTIFQDDPVIQFQVEDGYFNYLQVYDKLLRFHHGDAIKYGGGIGGLSIPLTKAVHRANQQRKADADFIGHFHQLMPYSRVNKFIVNGSLIGFNAYALRIGASPEEPLQSFHLVDAKRGFTISAPVITENEIGELVKPASTGWRQAA